MRVKGKILAPPGRLKGDFGKILPGNTESTRIHDGENTVDRKDDLLAIAIQHHGSPGMDIVPNGPGQLYPGQEIDGLGPHYSQGAS